MKNYVSFSVLVLTFLVFLVLCFYPVHYIKASSVYYIDYVNGSNANDGLAKVTGGGHGPWKTHPYMQTGSACTSTGAGPLYTHIAGDQFIFKIGVVWPNACFAMHITHGGASSSVMDYYGVDPTWCASTCGTADPNTGILSIHPVFDMQSLDIIPSSVCGNGGTNWSIICEDGKNGNSGGYIHYDQLEIRNYFMNASTNQGPSLIDCGVNHYGTAAEPLEYTSLAEHMYMHGITTTTAIMNAHAGSNCLGMGFAGIGEVRYSIMDGRNNTVSGNAVSWGGCFANVLNIHHNQCLGYHQGWTGFAHLVHDNEFGFGSNKCCLSVGQGGTYNNGDHTNTMENAPDNSAPVWIYNNYTHDNDIPEQCLQCQNVQFFNNIFTRTGSFQIGLGPCNCFGGCSGPGPSDVTNVLNNTFDCQNGATCVVVGGGSANNWGGGTLNIKNNLYINNSNFGQPIFYNGGSPVNLTQNLAPGSVGGFNMSPAVATTDNYVYASKFSGTPSVSNSSVVAAGPNLSSLCPNTNMAALCQDPEGTLWYGGTAQNRPASGNWTLGAYVWPPGGSGTTPNVSISPTSQNFGTQNVGTVSSPFSFTITNVSGAPTSVTAMTPDLPWHIDGTNACPAVPFTLGTGAHCITALNFAPNGSAGARSGNLSVTAGGIITTAALTGTANAPVLSLTPNPVAFGSQPQFTTSAAMTITVTNGGSGAQLLGTPYFTISGTNGSDFANTGAGTCTNGGTIAVGSSCTVTITFTPSIVAGETATLGISGNSSASVAMSGTGTSSSSVPLVAPEVNPL